MKQFASDALEPFQFGVRHLGTPPLEAIDLRRLLDQRKYTYAICSGDDAASIVFRSVAFELDQTLGCSFMIIKHDRVIGQFDEFTDLPQDIGGVPNEVFITDFEVAAKVGHLAPRLVDAGHPPTGCLLTRVGSEPEVLDRKRDVTTVANQMNESRFRQKPLDETHTRKINRRLVAPP